MSEPAGDNVLVSFHCDWNENFKVHLMNMIFPRQYISFIPTSHASLEFIAKFINQNQKVTSFFGTAK